MVGIPFSVYHSRVLLCVGMVVSFLVAQPVCASVFMCVSTSGNATCSEVVCDNATCPERRTGHSTVVDPDSKMLYLYGGSKGAKWYSDVQALDLTTWKWQKLEVRIALCLYCVGEYCLVLSLSSCFCDRQLFPSFCTLK